MNDIEKLKLAGHRKPAALDAVDMALFRAAHESGALGEQPLKDGRLEVGYLRWVPALVKSSLQEHLPWCVVRWTAHIDVGKRTVDRPIEHPGFSAYYLLALWHVFGLEKRERHVAIIGELDKATRIVTGPRYFPVFQSPTGRQRPTVFNIDQDDAVYFDLGDVRASLELEFPDLVRARFDGEGGFRW